MQGGGEAGGAVKTPMMRQYLEQKRRHPGEILLFRMGDFYETFLDDAKTVSGILGIALTARSKDAVSGEKIPLAGFPWHALDGYLTRLVKAGYRVAICEQLEDPAKARGLVKREVVEVITPGTLVSGPALGERETLLLCAVHVKGARAGIALCDLSTGGIEATELDRELLWGELARLMPRELLKAEGAPVKAPDGCETTELEPWKFDADSAVSAIGEGLGVSALEGLDLQGRDAARAALGALLQYVADTKGDTVDHLHFRRFYSREDFMILDGESARALGVTEAAPGDDTPVLVTVTDETVTPPGSRLWRSWLTAPPMDPAVTGARLDAVEELVGAPDTLVLLRRDMSECADLQRQAGKLGTQRSGPRDVEAIRRTAGVLPVLAGRLSAFSSPLLTGAAGMDLLQDVHSWIVEVLSDEPPARAGEPGTVRRGFSEELDRLRGVRSGGKEWIAALVEKEKRETGIPRLSVGCNRVFGYYIEVPKSSLDMVPGRYSRKQTLTGAERFVTPELTDMESTILGAEERIEELEREIFLELRDRLAGELPRIRTTGEVLASLDVLCSLASMALERGYVRPGITDGHLLEIREGMHPVLERVLPSGECVPNDTDLHPGRRIVLVTGPNMAGKSTYLRQAALLAIMAQAGSFVPAASMRFSPVDRVFTRIGSADRLTRGQSTFLVEMSDVAVMLNSSTPASLAILDEVGRGTSTFDGLSIAWATLEFLHDDPDRRPLVLFATHFHELAALASRLPAAASVNTMVRETGRSVVFLYRVEEGSADRSYGIHVASMAGVPGNVLRRARQVMSDLESGRHLMPGADTGRQQLELQLNRPENPVLDDIRALDPDSLTPLRALEILYQLLGRLK
jgi:DNA mismatch repair protein MutS